MTSNGVKHTRSQDGVVINGMSSVWRAVALVSLWSAVPLWAQEGEPAQRAGAQASPAGDIPHAGLRMVSAPSREEQPRIAREALSLADSMEASGKQSFGALRRTVAMAYSDLGRHEDAVVIWKAVRASPENPLDFTAATMD